ncbi:MAG: CBS domain-containing protein [Melioribacteraceae bacterium]|jgi:CBS domain-containing protein|nr:CBS domain-containing protein [Melioribacteraceae bacterium]RJP56953.1 MAG: CBS domain-containing protein [Ignavibacteriales bacterium]WKZ68267.1 MAG: CBS domain-containing protein [Melioribacteraceae bacterium]
MATLKQILDQKGYEIFSVSPKNTVYEALQLMAEKGIGALPVFDSNKLVGIMSERDYARKIILKEKSSKQALVEEIMSKEVIYVESNRTDEECLALIVNKRVRHLPVVEGEDIIGFISIGDVVKSVIDSKEFVIEQLINYINDKPVIKKV